VERSRCDWQLDWAVWDNRWLLPSSLLVPINGQHVVRVIFTKLVIHMIRGLNLLDGSLMDFNITRLNTMSN
jgi:hypothetical protein